MPNRGRVNAYIAFSALPAIPTRVRAAAIADSTRSVGFGSFILRVVDAAGKDCMRSSNPTVANALIANTTGGALFKCPRCHATGCPYDGFCRDCGYLLPMDKMLWRANELIERELRKTMSGPIKGLAYLKGIGRIDLEIGHKGIGPGQDYGSGLSKILQKHLKDVPHLGATIVLGKTYNPKEEGKIGRDKDGYEAILGKRDYGATLITHFKRKGRS